MRRSVALPAERGAGRGHSPRATEQGRGDSGEGRRIEGDAALAAGGGLLGAYDPLAFEVFNTEEASPIVLLCDHASNRVPRALDNLGLPPTELERKIAEDIEAAAIARRIAVHFFAPAVLAGRLHAMPIHAARHTTARMFGSGCTGISLPTRQAARARPGAARADCALVRQRCGVE